MQAAVSEAVTGSVKQRIISVSSSFLSCLAVALLHRLCSAEGLMEVSWLSTWPLALQWHLAFWLRDRCQVSWALHGLDFTCDNCCVGLEDCTSAVWHCNGSQRPLVCLCDPNSACKVALNANLSAGGHLNPAVTFAMCFLAREPWIKLPIYALAQTLGAFLGAGIVFGLYYGKWKNLMLFVRVRLLPFLTHCRKAGFQIRENNFLADQRSEKPIYCLSGRAFVLSWWWVQASSINPKTSQHCQCVSLGPWIKMTRLVDICSCIYCLD